MFETVFTEFRRLINIIINFSSIIAQISPRDEVYKYFAHPESMFLRGKIINGDNDE